MTMKRKIMDRWSIWLRQFVLIVFVLHSSWGFATNPVTATPVHENTNLVQDENRAEYMGMKLYKGQLHSHTSLSDGIGLPNDAYEYVKQNTDLDFYAVTEHDVTFESKAGWLASNVAFKLIVK